MTIRAKNDHIRVLLYSYFTTLTELGGVLVKIVPELDEFCSGIRRNYKASCFRDCTVSMSGHCEGTPAVGHLPFKIRRLPKIQGTS